MLIIYYNARLEYTKFSAEKSYILITHMKCDTHTHDKMKSEFLEENFYLILEIRLLTYRSVFLQFWSEFVYLHITIYRTTFCIMQTYYYDVDDVIQYLIHSCIFVLSTCCWLEDLLNSKVSGKICALQFCQSCASVGDVMHETMYVFIIYKPNHFLGRVAQSV